jgi:apolipoprotein N-acyltransferase
MESAFILGVYKFGDHSGQCMSDQHTKQVKISADDRSQRSGNMVHLVSWRHRLRPYGLATLSAVCLALSHPPCELAFLAWVAFIPVLVSGLKPGGSAFRLGYVFGLVYFTLSLAWLRTIFLPVPLLLASVIAFYPALWLKILSALCTNLRYGVNDDLLPRADPARPVVEQSSWQRNGLLILAGAALWCGLEWTRGWLFAGFPWNPLGITQWVWPSTLGVIRFTGIFGLSFLIMLVNLSVWSVVESIRRRGRGCLREPPTYIMPGVAILITAMVIVMCRIPATEPSEDSIRIAAIQGNLEQMRVFQDGQLARSISVYMSESERVLKNDKPDILVWPETAVPISLTCTEQGRKLLQMLHFKARIPLILGTLDYRAPEPDDVDQFEREYNTAILIDGAGRLAGRYDKRNIVPFGEYTPFGQYMPWLVDWIGMGRGLSPGQEATVFNVDDRVRIGVNICYEDAFANTTRETVLNDADVLLVITNDAWYQETCGSRQHLAHTLLRAVENNRPLLRNGNNSDTCLIMPDGRIVDMMYDHVNDTPFLQASHTFAVPIYRDRATTFYTRNGDVFAILCAVLGLAAAGYCAYRFFNRKQRLHDMIRDNQA